MGKVTTRKRSHSNKYLSVVKQAICNGDLETVRDAVVTRKVPVNSKAREHGKEYSLLSYACLKNQLEVSQLLISLKAAVIGKDAVRFADYPLRIAADLGHIQICKLLISHGGGTQSINDSLLLNACRSAQPVDFIEFLVNNHANPNLTNQYGSSPLQFSLFGNHSCSVTDVLLTKASEIRVNHQDNNRCSALMYAARIKCTKCLDLLLDKGADANQINVFGELAVHFFLENLTRKAASHEDIRIFRKLLRHTDKDILRRTALTQEYKSRVLSSVLNSKAYVYLDIVREENFELADFLPRDVISAELLEDLSVHFSMTREPYRTQSLRALIQRGVLSDPRIYANILHPKYHSGILLGFVQLGLNIPRRVTLSCRIQDLAEYNPFIWDPTVEFYEDVPVYASNALQIRAILRVLRVVDDVTVRAKLDKIVSRKSYAEPAVQRYVVLVEQLIGKVDTLQSMCRAEIRQIFFKSHGQRELRPFIEKLSLPKGLRNFLTLNTRDDTLSSIMT